MPRSISVIKKYLPTLDMVLSVSWSQVLGGCSRKFLGGAPLGVAYPLLAAARSRTCCAGVMLRAPAAARTRGLAEAMRPVVAAVGSIVFWVIGVYRMR